MSDDGQLIIEERDRIAFVTFNRPEKLNAWTFEMSNELRDYLSGLNEGEYRIRCVVLTGTGRAFCSGADVGNLAARQGGERPPWRPPHPEAHITEALRRCNAPVIAAINGYALGMGLGIAMSCDIRIAADDARFQVAQMKRGLTADTALAHSLPAAIGAERAMELMFTARMIEAEEAERIGLVLKVVPADNLLEEAEALAREIAKNGPLGVAAAKRTVYLRDDDAFQRAHDFLGLTMDRLFLTEDAREGISSFAERREPEFPGR